MRFLACAKYPTKVCDLLRKNLSLLCVGATVQLSVTTNQLFESATTVKFLNPFRKPSPKELAQRELEEAQRQLLVAQSSADYARRIAEYNGDRIKRLTAFLKKEGV